MIEYQIVALKVMGLNPIIRQSIKINKHMFFPKY